MLWMVLLGLILRDIATMYQKDYKQLYFLNDADKRQCKIIEKINKIEKNYISLEILNLCPLQKDI